MTDPAANVRVIPCLLLQGTGFVKTTRFQKPVYLGDPVNIVKLFNDMEVDELGILDIRASAEGRGPSFDLLKHIADNAFMPLSYGGGLKDLEAIRRILGIGYEKVIVNTAAFENPGLITDAARIAGNQSIVVSMDVKRSLRGQYEVYAAGGRRPTKCEPVAFARRMEELGVGEILLTAIDRDGTMTGYDTALIRMVSEAVSIPVIACGGSGSAADFARAVREGGASAVAAASLFVFHGPRRAVLISFPTRQEIEDALRSP
ncbi:MAG: imidazole glycerol phosphate synthase subunit HisF [Acidobacteria bacterium]|nr:imidazole glycerol phosphate synthase subunit HisF [Acidobacteriota bacterium]